MPTSIRRTHRSSDHSRFIFGASLLSLIAVACLLVASGSNSKDTFAQAQIDHAGRKGELASQAPAVTPTPGGRIAFIEYSGPDDSRLFYMKADGTDITPVGSEYAYFPDWSWAGTKLAYETRVTGQFFQDIITIDVNGTNRQNITNGSGENYFPTWSPDDSKIAFVKYGPAGDRSAIWVMNANGSSPQQLTFPGENVYDGWLTWSPDGAQIAYVHNSAEPYEIRVMNANGSNQHAILSNPTYPVPRYPDWSPDGTKIAFVEAHEASVDRLFVMDPNGANIQLVTDTFHNIDRISWSPDGHWFVAEALNLTEGPGIYIVSADGTNIYPIKLGNDYISPVWDYTPQSTVIIVEDEDGLPVEGAQVFKNCNLVGTTSVTGTLTLPSASSVDDELIARASVYTGTTQKGGHDGWAYQVWLTNILQNNDGTESPYVVTTTNRVTHTLTLLPTNAQIGFNLVASVEYNTTPEHLSQIEVGFKEASDYLRDVTDGQMFFEKVKLYEDHQHWNDADFQFHAWHPRASAVTSPDGISSLTGVSSHIDMDGPDDYGVPYNQYNAYTTLIHEFGHYAIGAYDEYYKWNLDDYPTSCTVDFDDIEYDVRASIMFNQRESSEFCATIAPITHNNDTAQGYIHGESVWETLVDNWSSDDELWELRSPMTRGTVNKGPIYQGCPSSLGTAVETFNVPGAACAPLTVIATYSNGDPAVGASINVRHNSTYFYEGDINAGGVGTAVGAQVGDTVLVGTLIGGVPYNSSAIVADCVNTISVVLTNTAMPATSIEEGSSAASLVAWPAYWLQATPNWTLNVVDITLRLSADPPAQPALYASQGSNNRQAVALTYNSVQRQYTGAYTFNPALSPDFQFDLELPVDGGVAASVYRFLGGQFHTGGPSGYENMKNVGAPHGNDPDIAPVAWGLLRPESMADVIVDPTSLPEGTGVMVGESGMPADGPTGLLAVGGPYSVLGQNPISGEVGITLSYLSEYYCGLEPGSASIYRYTGTGWEAIPTTLIDEWHQAGGTITQWGIYAVFARLNAQTTFSDVPVGSTFYDYISWITCHGIASGYSDNTFRPNNNATRGQISKMISLAYQWYLEPPANNYTFADVLPGSTFHLYVEAAYREGVVSGYPCGGAGEPCDPQNRPYFRPSNNVTRGQIAKIIANGSKFNDPASGQTFEDVPAGSTFHEFVERMASRTIINGYACGGPGEPCVPPTNRPYFRPSANATRGQLSKMIYLAAQPR